MNVNNISTVNTFEIPTSIASHSSDRQSVKDKRSLIIFMVGYQIIQYLSEIFYKLFQKILLLMISDKADSKPQFDFDLSFKKFMEQKKRDFPEDAKKINLLQNFDLLKQEINSSLTASAVIGPEEFRNKKIKMGKRLKKIENFNGVHGILQFGRGLSSYYNTLRNSLTSEEEKSFQQIFVAYHTFLFSALLFQAQNKDPIGKWDELAAKHLQKNLSDVRSGKISRGYWAPSLATHFVALKYEKRKEQLVVGVFNLGKGKNELNRHFKKYISETRFNKSAFESLGSFSSKVTQLQSTDQWTAFLDANAHYLKRAPAIPERSSQHYHPEQLPQSIGNCTGRSQWALLKSEFYLQFGKHPTINYSQFKKFFQNQVLLSIPHSQSERQIEKEKGEGLKNSEILTSQQVYDICRRSLGKL